jgi:hypothetical protein
LPESKAIEGRHDGEAAEYTSRLTIQQKKDDESEEKRTKMFLFQVVRQEERVVCLFVWVTLFARKLNNDRVRQLEAYLNVITTTATTAEWR